MDYAILYSESYLAHHGILGQKWGVRRFQNADGSYTNAGKDRYGRSRKQANLEKDSKSYAAAKKANQTAKDVGKVTSAVEDLDKSSSAIEKMHYKYKSRRMSDEQLDEEINKMLEKEEATRERREKEARYQQLKNQEVNTGREVLRDALDVVGKITTGATAAATLYILMRDVLNS